jgi:hypothetical protein
MISLGMYLYKISSMNAIASGVSWMNYSVKLSRSQCKIEQRQPKHQAPSISLNWLNFSKLKLIVQVHMKHQTWSSEQTIKQVP